MVLDALVLALDAFVQALIQDYGLLGLFIGAIAANATVLLPVPLDIVVFMLGGVIRAENLGIWFAVAVALVTGLGAAIGEMTAYIAGLLGMTAVEKARGTEAKRVVEIRNKLKNKGMVVIFAGALTPFPFDLIGIAAGLIKYDPKRFFLGALCGKIVRYFLIVFAAYFGVEVLEAFFLL